MENQLKKGAVPPLTLRGYSGSEADYQMDTNADTVWITVGTLSICIRQTQYKVTVGLYPEGEEAEGAMLEQGLSFNMADAESLERQERAEKARQDADGS